MEDTNIIDFVTGVLRFSVVSVLHLIFAAVTMAFFVLSNVCRSVVIFSLFFRCHDLNGHKATRKRFSSRQQRLIVDLSVAYVGVSLLLLLPCTAMNHNRSNTRCKRPSTGPTLATTAAVAGVSKKNVKRVCSNTLNT